jgi:hypothetical protein
LKREANAQWRIINDLYKKKTILPQEIINNLYKGKAILPKDKGSILKFINLYVIENMGISEQA